jgi:hypothetical protein
VHFTNVFSSFSGIDMIRRLEALPNQYGLVPRFSSLCELG